ncbi:MAG: STAS domain-containing protein [Anaerolineae bacterium]|nr:STAS domain-containing protein [Anaerolineae bacterium]
MDISQEIYDPVIVIHLTGRWDAKTAPNVEDVVSAHIAPECCILLDLAGVDYMSSAGLRTLLLMYRGVNEVGGCIALSGLSDRLQDTMSITGFLHHFDCYGTVEDGLAALRS